MFTISKELQSEIRRYSARIAYDIRSRRKREEVGREYAEHLEDAVYYRIVQCGMEEMDAFRDACDELGNVTKMQELLALTHNKDPLPMSVKVLLGLLCAAVVGSSYFWFENKIYRAYFVFILQLCILVLTIVLLIQAGRYLRALHIRRRAYRRLKEYAAQNGLIFIRRANSYRSIFQRTATPEWILETDTHRYILSLFATVKRRQELRLTDFQLYQYISVSGIRNMILLGAGAGAKTYSITSLGTMRSIYIGHTFHHGGQWGRLNVTLKLPKGFHLLPEIDWSSAEHPTKQNVRVLLLNPIPMKIFVLEHGRLRPSGDDDTVDGMRIWSASGLVSHLEGVRISGKHDHA